VREAANQSCDRSDQLAAALELARAETAMDVAVLAEVRNGREVAHAIAGDGASFGLRPGASLAIQDTYCERLLDGRISNIVRDAQHDQSVNDLPLTRLARIGAYIGVPISIEDVRLYILCCLAHEQRPRLGEHDVLFIRGLAATIIATMPERVLD
jgi:GAF domain-containing protein